MLMETLLGWGATNISATFTFHFICKDSVSNLANVIREALTDSDAGLSLDFELQLQQSWREINLIVFFIRIINTIERFSSFCMFHYNSQEIFLKISFRK